MQGAPVCWDMFLSLQAPQSLSTTGEIKSFKTAAQQQAQGDKQASPVPFGGLPVRQPQLDEDISLGGRGQSMARCHLGTPGASHHSRAERVLRQAHALGPGQGAHGAVEVSRAREVEQGTGELAVRHHDDVQPAVPLRWPGQAAHAQVLLLITVVLLTHQVICKEAWEERTGQEELSGRQTPPC